MDKRTTASTDESQVRLLLDTWTKALASKDIDGLMAHYTPDVLAFDLAPPLRYSGIDAYRKSYADWFASFQVQIGYEIHELSVAAGDGVAWGHSLNRITGKRTGGEDTDVWIRATVGFRKVHGEWKVAHEHFSVPYYMEPPYEASLDLKP